MKIAVVTDNGQTISAHFGRAPYYLVFTVEDGAISRRELREKAGHHQFAGEHHDHDHHLHVHGAHGDCHEHGHEHGTGPHAADKHGRMIETITDCQVVIVRGMGRGAYTAMQQASIKPIITDIADPEAAVHAYLAGTIVDHTERLH